MRTIIFFASLLWASSAIAHDSFIGKMDPVTGGSCCTTAQNEGYGDCAVLKVEPGMLTGEDGGYRLRLTAEQASKINPVRGLPVDTFIPQDRIQDSWDGNYRLCIPSRPSEAMRADFYCFFAPANS